MMRRATMSGRQAIGVASEPLQRDPFVDQRAGIGAGDAGFGGAQMAQPAEAEQRRPPIRPTAASISNGERPSQITTLPAKAKRPA